MLGVGVLLAAGAESLWQLPLLSLGSGLIVVALLVTVEAPQLSALWARFPLPVIPAPGDPTPSAPSLRVLQDLPRRVRISDAHQIGFIAGAVLLSVIGSVAIALRPETLSAWGWYVVAATSAGTALRARVWDSAACKAWLLAQPHLVSVALVVLYTATGRYLAALDRCGSSRGVGIGIGRRCAQPGNRFSGQLLAAAAQAGGLLRVGNRRIADPGDRLSGRHLQLGAQSMISAPTRRRCGCLAAVLAAALWVCPPALAISRPQVDPGSAPPKGAPGPVQPMEKNGECSITGVISGTDFGAATPSQTMLDPAAAWRFSRGDGQLVAVLDTGVRPGPRLPGVQPGGDYIETTDGLTDCDGHGTLVAGLIAGQPGDDAFAGIAPSARLLSLRVTSAKFSPRTGGGDPTLARAAADVAALGRAIVHAVDLGARVIAISAITCLPADRNVDQSALGAAIRYAAIDKDAVIVAAAGNSGSTGSATSGAA